MLCDLGVQVARVGAQDPSELAQGLARQAGIAPIKIAFSGVGKREDEIRSLER